MTDAFKVVRDFEQALCDFTGAKYAVTTTSCTMALLLAVRWHLQKNQGNQALEQRDPNYWHITDKTLTVGARPHISIPKRTYVGVPMSIIHAGGRPVFRNEEWSGYYRLSPLPVYDSARWFTHGMFDGNGAKVLGAPAPFSHQDFEAWKAKRMMVCVSFHWSKTLGIQQGGAILHDDPEADEWLRRARFDGRKEGVPPKEDYGLIIGHHCYMSPETAAAGLVRLNNLPKHNAPLPWGPGTNSDYPDISTMECFK